MRRQPLADRGEDRLPSVVDGDDVAISLGPHHSSSRRREQRKCTLGGVGRNAVILPRLDDQRGHGHAGRCGASSSDDARELEDQAWREESVRPVSCDLLRVSDRAIAPAA